MTKTALFFFLVRLILAVQHLGVVNPSPVGFSLVFSTMIREMMKERNLELVLSPSRTKTSTVPTLSEDEPTQRMLA